jgi:phage gp29-like protein
MQEQRLQEMLDTLVKSFQNAIIAHPNNTKIEALPVGDSKSVENYTQALDVFNREIDMTILGNNLSSEVQGGSYAAASAHMDVRADIVDEDKRMIEASMNQLIEWIVWYNFNPNSTLPKFRLYKDEKPGKDQATMDIMLAKLGVQFDKSYFERRYGLNENEFVLGQPIQDLGPGIQGSVASAITEDDEEDNLSNADVKEISTAGIEAKDVTSNSQTKLAVERSQAKGYPYSEFDGKKNKKRRVVLI